MPTNLPIFVATHPRACSTAFERVFMTRTDLLTCIHEPFGDAFYYGPERLSERYENDPEAREKSGFADVTYKDVVDKIDEEIAKGKRVFIKDIIHYLFPPEGAPASIAPSLANSDTTPLQTITNGTAPTANGTNPTTNGNTTPNPTVLPLSILSKFHFTFLIRHPRRAIPSYYRCTIPPLSHTTGFHHFLPSEAGYDEVRRTFDYLRSQHLIGTADVPITVVDADDLLDRPAEVLRAYCDAVGVDFRESMLRWGDEKSRAAAAAAFEKWNGFHEDAIGSCELKAREGGVKTPTIEEENEQWRQKYGEEGQRVIRETVDANLADYEYLKGFALQV